MEKLSFRAVLLDLQLSYDRTLHLGYLWPGLSPARLADPDALWRKDPDLATIIAGRNVATLQIVLGAMRRRATTSDDYRISDHALALRALAAEELILHLMARHAPPDLAEAPPRAG